MPRMTREELFESFVNANPSKETFTRSEIIEHAESVGALRGTATGILNMCEKVRHGVYTMSISASSANPVAEPETDNVVPLAAVESNPEPAPVTGTVQSVANEDVYIPERIKEYVRWGHFKDVKTIIESEMFYPVFISGLSGNGKTMMVEQACAMTKREYVRVQITPETDEDDLIGGFRLVNGETVFAKGPVIKAMEAGAILLIDEIDRGSNKLMALQGVLEGKPVLIKKTGEVVKPAKGFNVIGTANTKGQGDEEGRFIAATIIDEAFLERFTITMEQPYPTTSVERKIVTNHMKKFGVDDEDFTEKLVQWGQAIRKTFEDGGVEEIVSTRRLCHIAQTFSIFGDRKKSVTLCVNRFDSDTRAAFIDLYEKMDVKADPNEATPSSDGTYTYENDSPF